MEHGLFKSSIKSNIKSNIKHQIKHLDNQSFWFIFLIVFCNRIKMRYEMEKNSRVLYGEIPFIGNTKNESFIALTTDGLMFIEELILGNEIIPENLSDMNRQILDTAINLRIVAEKDTYSSDTNDRTFSSYIGNNIVVIGIK